MDLNDAAVFVRVVQTGSFSATARALGVPTSTISTRVTRLEKRLGVTLLQRTTRSLHLTEAGETYFHHAATGLAHFQDAESALRNTLAEPAGRLQVTAPADIGDCLLADILTGMRREFPSINIEMMLMNRYADLVSEGIDAAIRTGPLKDSTLIAKYVGSAIWLPFASHAYLDSSQPLESPMRLREHCCLQFTPQGKDVWTLTTPDEKISVPLTGKVLVNDIGVIKTMTLAGEGVAMLPSYLCHEECARGELVRVLPGWQGKTDPIHLVYPRQRFVPHQLRAFLALSERILGHWLSNQSPT